MKRAPKKTQQIDTVLTCRIKANVWGKDEDKETREALFHYLLIRARCQRDGNLTLLQHVNSGMRLYAKMAKYHLPALDDSQEPPSLSQGDNYEPREGPSSARQYDTANRSLRRNSR